MVAAWYKFIDLNLGHEKFRCSVGLYGQTLDRFEKVFQVAFLILVCKDGSKHCISLIHCAAYKVLSNNGFASFLEGFHA